MGSTSPIEVRAIAGRQDDGIDAGGVQAGAIVGPGVVHLDLPGRPADLKVQVMVSRVIQPQRIGHGIARIGVCGGHSRAGQLIPRRKKVPRSVASSTQIPRPV